MYIVVYLLSVMVIFLNYLVLVFMLMGWLFQLLLWILTFLCMCSAITNNIGYVCIYQAEAGIAVFTFYVGEVGSVVINI